VSFIGFGGIGLHDIVKHGRDGLVGNAVFYGLVCALFLASATTRVEAVADQLVVVNLVSVTSFTADAIAEAEGRNGLSIRAHDGRSVGFWGYGDSVAGLFTANRQARDLAHRICEWRDEHRSAEYHPNDAAEVRTRLRVSAPIGATAGVALLACVGLLAG
jgi:hypothetical protein